MKPESEQELLGRQGPLQTGEEFKPHMQNNGLAQEGPGLLKR